MSNVIWEPNPGPQTALVTSPISEIFFGGARGGGKSDGLLGDFAIHAGEYGEHARGIIFRRTLPEFREIELRSLQLYKRMGATYKRADREWVFPNGATLIMRYLYDKTDAANYQGHSYTWIGVDEAGSWPNPDAIDLMRATMRSAHGVPTYMRLTGNPGGLGHLWLKERYIDPAPPFTPHEYAPQPDHPQLTVQAVFIPSRLEDNPFLLHDPKYVARLAAAGGPALFRAWRYGDWNAIIGAAFSEWRTEVHVKRMDKIPAGWRIIGGMDWGFGAPGAFYLIALDGNGRAYVFWEYYFNNKTNEPGTPARTLGKIIARAARELRVRGVMEKYPEYVSIDRDTFATADGRGGRWESTANLFQQGIVDELGEDAFPVIGAPKGKGSRHSGKSTIHQMLSFDVDEEGNIPDHLAPQLRIHPRCVHLIRTLPALPVDPNDPEDVDTEAEDHAYDALRYGLAARSRDVLRIAEFATAFDQHPGLTPGGERREPGWEANMKRQHGSSMIHMADRWTRVRPEDRRDGVSIGFPG